MDDAGGGRRGPRPLLTPELARAVEETWGCDLGAATPLGGSTGLNLRAGLDDQPVVVRVHRAHVTQPRVEALQLAREAAARGGVPTAAVIRGRSGERCVTVGSCVVEVEELIASDAKMDSLPRIERAMAVLAGLHDALAIADLPGAAADAAFANYLSAGEAEAKTAAGSRRIRGLDEGLRPIADAADALAGALAEVEAAAASLPRQWCHGDFWDDNVLLRGDDVALVADFGFLGLRPRIDDLALTAYFTASELFAAAHPDPMRALVALVDAYDDGTRRPLSADERDLLPLAIARQPLWSIGVWAAELDDPRTVAAHLRGHEAALEIGLGIVRHVDDWRRALRR